MTCLSSPPSSTVTPDLVERYLRARARWIETSGPITSSSGPAAAPTAGSNQTEASTSSLSLIGTSTPGGTNGSDLFERLAALALASGGEAPEGRPPIHAYSLCPGVDGGETMVATEEYRAWFCRQYGVSRDEIRRTQRSPADSSGERAVQTGPGGKSLGHFRKPT